SLISILGGELGSRVEAHGERSNMRTQFLDRRNRRGTAAELAELRVRHIAAMAIRIAIVVADLVQAIELAVGHVVAHLVPAVVGEPELAGARLPGEADGVAHTLRDGLATAAIRIHAQDLRVALRTFVADVAGGADRHVQLAVRSERDVAPA